MSADDAHGRSLQQGGYPIRRVDVTREPELAAQFRVDVSLLVMLSDGNEVIRCLARPVAANSANDSARWRPTGDIRRLAPALHR